MIKTQRIENIIEYVEQHQTASLEQLANQFSVSLNTIRRDIHELVNEKKLRKVHGGVTLQPSPVEYEKRETINESAKRQIARATASLIEDDDIIFLDTGTTAVYLVEYISSRNVTIITNNLNFIMQSGKNSNLTVISTGGLYDQTTNSFVHLQNSNVLDTYNINKAFMATTGITINSGVTHASPLENEIKKQVVQKNCAVYVLADSSKFGKHALFTYSKLNDIDGIVTENLLGDEYVDYFSSHDIALHVAKDILNSN